MPVTTPLEMEQAYQANVANIRAMCEARIAALTAKHKLESDRWDAERIKLSGEIVAAQRDLAAEKEARQAELKTAVQRVAEIEQAAGGIEAVAAIIKQRQIAVEEEAERKLLTEAAEKRKKIEELRK